VVWLCNLDSGRARSSHSWIVSRAGHVTAFPAFLYFRPSGPPKSTSVRKYLMIALRASDLWSAYHPSIAVGYVSLINEYMVVGDVEFKRLYKLHGRQSLFYRLFMKDAGKMKGLDLGIVDPHLYVEPAFHPGRQLL